jgi:O-acetyl-ADP-ribose deacetylase (regulator of RNase III)
LPARFVIHTVGPVWGGGTSGEAELLAACYRNVLTIAYAQSLSSIAFPAISCGVFGYPPNEAARIALVELCKSEHATLAITICCRGSEILESYRSAAAHLGITLQG